jgi:hypothetical protein
MKPDHSLVQCAGLCLVARQALADDKPFIEVKALENCPFRLLEKRSRSHCSTGK